jgi:hypothetical protein
MSGNGRSAGAVMSESPSRRKTKAAVSPPSTAALQLEPTKMGEIGERLPRSATRLIRPLSP